MDKQQFFGMLNSEAYNDLLYIYYLENLNGGKKYSREDFSRYLQVWRYKHSVNLQILIDDVVDRYYQKFGITKLFDKNKNLIKIY